MRVVLGEGLQDESGVEAVGEHQGAGAVQAGTELADHAGDVEQRRETVQRRALAQRAELAQRGGVRAEVAVGVGGTLGRAAGAGGVADQRDVLEREARLRRRRSSGSGGLEEVVRARRLFAGNRAEHTFVVAGLELQFARGERDLDRAVRDERADVAVPAGLRADERLDARVGQDVGELAVAVHRVDRHHDAAGLPGGDQCDDELRDVLQHDREPVAAGESGGGEVAGDAVGKLVQLAVVQPRVEVRDRRGVGDARDGTAERFGQRGRCDRLRGLHPIVVAVQPRFRVVQAHSAPSLPSFGHRPVGMR